MIEAEPSNVLNQTEDASSELKPQFSGQPQTMMDELEKFDKQMTKVHPPLIKSTVKTKLKRKSKSKHGPKKKDSSIMFGKKRKSVGSSTGQLPPNRLSTSVGKRKGSRPSSALAIGGVRNKRK